MRQWSLPFHKKRETALTKFRANNSYKGIDVFCGSLYMLENVWFVAAIWMALAFAASLISIWTGISVALIEILVGVAAGNFLHLHATTEWINFLAMLGSGVLTFLAGRF
jgi:hypothetical protein